MATPGPFLPPRPPVPLGPPFLRSLRALPCTRPARPAQDALAVTLEGVTLFTGVRAIFDIALVPQHLFHATAARKS